MATLRFRCSILLRWSTTLHGSILIRNTSLSFPLSGRALRAVVISNPMRDKPRAGAKGEKKGWTLETGTVQKLAVKCVLNKYKLVLPATHVNRISHEPGMPSTVRC